MPSVLRDQTIVCFAQSTWRLWRSSQELMTRFARDNRVIYVEKQQYVTAYRSEGLIHYFGVWLGGLDARRVEHDITVVETPIMFPLFAGKLPHFDRSVARGLLRLNYRLLARRLRQCFDRLGVSPSIYFYFQPLDLLLLDYLPPGLVCYRVSDEVALLPSSIFLEEIMERVERERITRADLVFASSRSQFERRRGWGAMLHYVPNGADFEVFNQAALRAQTHPVSLDSISPPILGFLGKVDSRFDVELVAELSRRFPHCSVAIVGAVEGYMEPACRPLAELGNVHFLGQHPKAEAARLCAAFDVGLIPYQVNESTRSMYPLKLHEYLACGMPVVATDLPELYPYSHIVNIALSAEEFVDQVACVLAGGSDEEAERRMEVARENSWDGRFEEICGHILAYQGSSEGGA